MRTRRRTRAAKAAASSPPVSEEAQAELRTSGSTVHVTVRGEIDLHSAPDLRETLARAVEGHPELVMVHLDEVSFLDSTGLGILVGAWKAQRAADRELELVCSRPEPLKLLRLTGLDRVLTVHPVAPTRES
jgi:anti-sigma B factor antagonist